MGLDITAYKKVKLVKAAKRRGAHNWDDPLCDTDDHSYLDDRNYPEQADGLKAGIYKLLGKPFGFHAGSYTGYNAWREWLAELVDATPEELWNARGAAKARARLTPFYALIAFSDCEGFIGPKTSAKLVKDFDAFARKAKKSGRDYEMAVFKDFRKAFRIAAKGGIVEFH